MNKKYEKQSVPGPAPVAGLFQGRFFPTVYDFDSAIAKKTVPAKNLQQERKLFDNVEINSILYP
jgi:hypothetical protein